MEVSTIILVFIVLATVMIVLALLISERVKTGITVFGHKFWLEAIVRTNKKSGRRKPTKHYPAQNNSTGTMPKIWLEAPDNKWQSQKLTGYIDIYLGTGVQNTIRLRADSGADEVQACIYWNGHRYRVRNLSRKAPTLINGKSIREQNLGNGNKIQIGSTLLIFRQSSPGKH